MGIRGSLNCFKHKKVQIISSHLDSTPPLYYSLGHKQAAGVLSYLTNM